METVKTQIEKRYLIKDILIDGDEVYETKSFTLNELKELFKYDIMDAEDKEIVEDYNNEIDNCNSVEDIIWVLKMYRDIDYYEFIEVKEK